METTFARTRSLWVSLLLILAIVLVYGQTSRYGFISYDDPANVSENFHVQEGLTGDSVFWAFTNAEKDYWRPMSWLSFMLDYELYGLNAGGYHATNVLIHIANSLLLF